MIISCHSIASGKISKIYFVKQGPFYELMLHLAKTVALVGLGPWFMPPKLMQSVL